MRKRDIDLSGVEALGYETGFVMRQSEQAADGSKLSKLTAEPNRK